MRRRLFSVAERRRQGFVGGAIYGEPDAGLYRSMAEHGMDGAVSFPFSMELGERSSIDDKKRMMERYAETIIRRC